MGRLWLDFYVIGQFACNCYFFLYNAERTFDRKKKHNGMSSDLFAVINLTFCIF